MKDLIRYLTFALWFVPVTALASTNNLWNMLWYLTGSMLAMTAGWALFRHKEEKPKGITEDEALEGLVDSLLKSFDRDHHDHPSEFSPEGIEQTLSDFLKDGEGRSDQAKDEAFALLHRLGCRNYDGASNTKCDCKPIRIPYRDIERMGADVVARKIYDEMKPKDDES